MRHRRSHRHPVVESAVFVAAILLAAFIARELWSRRLPAPQAVPAIGPVALDPARPPLPSKAGAQRTETGVTAVAALKLTRVRPSKPKPFAVPAPR